MMKTHLTPADRDKGITQSCGTCRYYQAFEHDEEADAEDDEQDDDDPDASTGICRRYPPQFFPGIISASAWPEVSANKGWCGEFTPEG